MAAETQAVTCGVSTHITKPLQDASGKGRLSSAPLFFFSPKVRFNARLNTITLIKTFKSVLLSFVCVKTGSWPAQSNKGVSQAVLQ